MGAKRFMAATLAIGLGCVLGGCAATGLSEDAYAITQAECQATIEHLSRTEPEFAGLASSSHAWAVFPGEFNGLWYLFGGGGSDGLVYNNAGEVIGYSRHARINLGLGGYGEYGDFVVFFPDEAALSKFQEGGWSFGGHAAAGIFGLAASGQSSYTRDVTMVSDPRLGGGIGAFLTFSNFSYNNIDDALTK